MNYAGLGAGVFIYLFFVLVFLFISMLPLYFCIKWAFRKAIRETINPQYLK